MLEQFLEEIRTVNVRFGAFALIKAAGRKSWDGMRVRSELYTIRLRTITSSWLLLFLGPRTSFGRSCRRSVSNACNGGSEHDEAKSPFLYLSRYEFLGVSTSSSSSFSPSSSLTSSPLCFPCSLPFAPVACFFFTVDVSPDVCSVPGESREVFSPEVTSLPLKSRRSGREV